MKFHNRTDTNIYVPIYILGQDLVGPSCFTVYLKKKKHPDKDIVIYNLTKPVSSVFRYHLPLDEPKYDVNDNCPSILDIPTIERSNDI